MHKLYRKYYSPPSLRLSIMIICEVVLLLSVSLAVMLYFSRQALKKEVILNAEQTLEGMSRHIDNVLLDVEQSAGNIYYEVLTHLNEPERMRTYCAKLVECNPYVAGCAIAFKPNYYPGREQMMVYVYRKGGFRDVDTPGPLIVTDKFGNMPYTEQEWFTVPMTTSRVIWTDPLEGEEAGGELLSLCIPITDSKNEIVGVMAVDLPITTLSQAVLDPKSLTNNYGVLLGSNSSFIIHPNPKLLNGKSVYELAKEKGITTMEEVTDAMMAGETGYRWVEFNGKEQIVFFKPFKRDNVPGRSNEKLNWSVGVVYSKADIYSSFNQMSWVTLAIAIFSLSLFFMLIRMTTRRQLKPLKELNLAAQRMAEGNYSDPIPETKEGHEIGHLQQQMRIMQQALATKESEDAMLIEQLEERNKALRKAFRQTEDADHVKTTYLHYISNQMTVPTEVIDRSVTHLCNNYKEISVQEANCEVETIKKQSNKLLELLNYMMRTTDKGYGKEGLS